MYVTGQRVRVQDGSQQYEGTVMSVALDGSQVEVFWYTHEDVDISANFFTDTKQIVTQETKPDICRLID